MCLPPCCIHIPRYHHPTHPPHTDTQREALVELGERHLKAIELERRVFIKSRALSLAQRLMLYARDELEMAVCSVFGCWVGGWVGG